MRAELDFDEMLAGFQGDRAERGLADLCPVDRHDRLHGRLDVDDEAPRLAAHLEGEGLRRLVPDDETLLDVEVALLHDVDRVVALAQQHGRGVGGWGPPTSFSKFSIPPPNP